MKNYINKKTLELLKELIKNKEYNFFKSEGGYKILIRQENKKLFALLDQIGFFKFNKTNRRKTICGLHQIVIYIYKGYKSFQLGGSINKHQMEVHHIDHDPSNNSHHNLEYTTPQNNKAIATIVNICCNMSMAKYYKAEVKYDLDSVRLFHNVPFCELLVKSIKAASNKLNLDLFENLMFALPFKQAKYIYKTCNQLMYS